MNEAKTRGLKPQGETRQRHRAYGEVEKSIARLRQRPRQSETESKPISRLQ